MKSFTGRVQWVFFFYEERLILSSSLLLLSKLLILLVRKYWGVLSWSEISDFILHIHDFVFVCPPNTQNLSLIENERNSSILICSLLCPEAFPEIQCEYDDFSFLAIGMATGFHKIYACLYLVLDSFHTIAHGILKTTSIDETALLSLSSWRRCCLLSH